MSETVDDFPWLDGLEQLRRASGRSEVHDWLAEAYRLVAEVHSDSGRTNLRALRQRVLKRMQNGLTPVDFLDLRLATPASSAEEVELLLECALSFLAVAQRCADEPDPYRAMAHLICAYQAIGMATPIAADLATRRSRAEEPWRELLEAVRTILREHPSTDKPWPSIAKAIKALGTDIQKANDEINARKSAETSSQKCSVDPEQLVMKWAKRGGPLEFEFRRVVKQRFTTAPNGHMNQITSRRLRSLRSLLGLPGGGR